MEQPMRAFLVDQLTERRTQALRAWVSLGRLIAHLGEAEQLAAQHDALAAEYRAIAGSISEQTVELYRQVDSLNPATITPEEIERLEVLANHLDAGEAGR